MFCQGWGPSTTAHAIYRVKIEALMQKIEELNEEISKLQGELDFKDEKIKDLKNKNGNLWLRIQEREEFISSICDMND